MKLDSETKARFWPELWEYFSGYFSALAFGAMLCLRFSASNVVLVAIAVGFVFSVFDWKSGFRARKQRMADREDARRWRNRHLTQEIFVDEDVMRLKAQGRVIEAIKRYRELHPEADLRAAKDAVDALQTVVSLEQHD